MEVRLGKQQIRTDRTVAPMYLFKWAGDVTREGAKNRKFAVQLFSYKNIGKQVTARTE